MIYPQTTIDQLNRLYIKFIKLTLLNTYNKKIDGIEAFNNNPTPIQASIILKKILKQQTQFNLIDPQTKTLENIQFNFKQQTPRKIPKRLNSNELIFDFNKQDKQNKINRIQTICHLEEKQTQQSNKLQNIRKLTGKLTEIFLNNHKKITQYNQMFKISNNHQYQLQNKFCMKKL